MRRLCVLSLGLALVAGCGHGGGPESVQKSLPSLVLQPSDLPPTFTRFDVGRIANLDVHPGPRADPHRFGRKGGWKARYKRSGSPTTRGPLVVESRADLFGGPGGAAKDLAAYEEEFSQTGRSLTPPRLGAEARAMTFRQGAVQFLTVAWRERNATGSVLVEGFAGHVELADALALARRQEARISAAVRG
jgi:hypothetical protein